MSATSWLCKKKEASCGENKDEHEITLRSSQPG